MADSPRRGRDDGAAEHLLRAFAVPVLLVPAAGERPWLLDRVLHVGWNVADPPASVGVGEPVGAAHD